MGHNLINKSASRPLPLAVVPSTQEFPPNYKVHLISRTRIGT